MIAGKILLFSIISSPLLARVPDISSRIYKPLEKVNDLSFNLRADHIAELISEKVLNVKLDEVKVNAYKYNDSKEIDVLGVKSMPSEIKSKIKELFINKAEIAWGTRLKDWIGSYKYVQEQDRWFIYEDDSGVLDIMEIKIKFVSQKLYVIEKKPTGTLRTTYNYVQKKWSNGLLVLDKVTRKIYEGNQSIKVINTIEYKKLDEFGWVPSILKSKTTQQVNQGSINKVERNLDEVYYFDDYKINQNSAKSWFSSNK